MYINKHKAKQLEQADKIKLLNPFENVAFQSYFILQQIVFLLKAKSLNLNHLSVTIIKCY